MSCRTIRNTNRSTGRRSSRRSTSPFHIILLAITGFTIYLSIRHDQVVEALRPFSEKVRDLPAGWLIPIAILVLISIPPVRA